jgi:hypothetical protein
MTTPAYIIRSEIQIKADRKGQQFAQYFSRPAHRWIRISMADARVALAMQGPAAGVA